MSQLAKKTATVLLIVAVIAVVDFKVYSLYEQYEESQIEMMEKIERTAESIRSGKKIYTLENTAELLSAAGDREPELYVLRFWAWLSIKASNFGVLTFSAGYIFGKRSSLVQKTGTD